jgi:hypothetical protein
MSGTCRTSKFSPEFYQNKLYKPENNSGCCSCGNCNKPDSKPKPIIKRGCVVRHGSCNSLKHKSCGLVRHRSCC